MSAVAGRVLIIPKGAYVAGTTYNMLDLVKYNSKSFLAKRTNTNVTPVDGADWMELTNDGVTSFNGRSGAVNPANGDYNMTNLGDVNLTTPTDGQGLRYNSQSGKWENGDAASAVSNLTDVDLTNLANGQILKYNSTAQKWENVDEKGHTIQNASGTAQTQRASLQYKDAFVSDDSTNGRTVVENVKEVTLSELSQATERGMYLATDEESVPIGTPSVDSVSYTASSDTYKSALNKLRNDVDFSKITYDAYVTIGNNVYHVDVKNTSETEVDFTTAIAYSTSRTETILLLKNSDCQYHKCTLANNSSAQNTDKSTDSITDGTVITLYYGTSSTVINLKTSADYCQYDEDTTVKQKIETYVLTLTLPSTQDTWSVSQALPSGWSANDTFVISAKIQANPNVWIGVNHDDKNALSILIESTGVSVASHDSYALGKTVKVVVQRFT